MRLRGAILFLCLLLAGCSGGGHASGGTAAPPPGPQLVDVSFKLELPQARGGSIQILRAEVSDPNPPYNLVTSPVIAPVPDGASSVLIRFSVLPGNWRVSVFGLDQDNQVVAASTPVVLALFPGQVDVERIALLSLGDETGGDTGGNDTGGPPGDTPALAPTSLQFAVQPPVTVDAGTLFTVNVAVLDQNGDLLTSATDPVTLTVSSATLGGTTTISAVNGVASFTDLVMTQAGSGYTLSATAPGLTGATSDSFDVLAPRLTAISLTPNPLALAGLTPKQLTATGTFTDGSTSDITSTITSWASDNPAVVMVSNTGLATGSGTPGTATISASRDGITGSVLATVGAGTAPRGNRIFPVGSAEEGVVLIDMNGDGRQDVITKDDPDKAIYLSLTQADGTLAPPTVVYSNPGAQFFRIAAGDLNGDNLTDIVLTRRGDGVFTVLTNNGAGGFTPNDVTLAGDNIWVAFGDLDQDTDMDLVIDQVTDSQFVPVLNVSGVLTPQAPVAIGAFGQNLVVANLDADTFPDVAVISGTSVQVYANNGAGGFSLASTPFTGGGGMQDIVAANFDGVNGLDLAFTNQATNQVQVLLNNGSGTFSAGPGLAVNLPYRVATADIDGVNGPDILGLDLNGARLYVYLNQGGGVFNLTRTVDTGGADELAVGNLDGINGPDVASSSVSPSGACLMFNQGGNLFEIPKLTTAGADILNQAVVADFDGMNGPDIAVADDTSSQVVVWLNQGGGTFGAPTAFGAGGQPRSLAAADLNGDGHVDLMTSINPGNAVTILLNTGAGSFTLSPSVSLGPATDLRHLALADMDGINGPDFVVTSWGADTVLVGLNNGSGSFPTVNSFAAGLDPDNPQVADFDADGDLDIAVNDANFDTVTVLRNTGTGAAFVASTLTQPPPDSNPFGLVAGDFDGLNGPDLVTTSTPFQNLVTIFKNLGGAVFDAGTNFGTFGGSAAGTDLSAVDLDGSGTLDLFLNGNDNYQVLSGQGDGTFLAPMMFAGGSFGTQAVGDLNGDGLPDVVIPEQDFVVKGRVFLIFGQ